MRSPVNNLKGSLFIGLLVVAMTLGACARSRQSTSETQLPAPTDTQASFPTTSPTRTVFMTGTTAPTRMLPVTTLTPSLPSLTSTPFWFLRTPAPVIKAPVGLIYTIDDVGTSTNGGEEQTWMINLDGQPVLWRADEPDVKPGYYYNQCECNGDVCVLDPRTGEQRNLTNTPDRVEWLTGLWFDRQDIWLLYSQSITEAQQVVEGWIEYLTTVRTDGTQYTLISNVLMAAPTLSTDGQILAYNDVDGSWLYDMGNGKRLFPVEVFGLSLEDVNLFSPSWSPDGKQIAWWMDLKNGHVTGDWTSAIGIFDLEAATIKILEDFWPPFTGGGFIPSPEWSPDGQWLSFYGRRAFSGESGIWVVSATGEDNYSVAEYGRDFAYDICDRVWSPDSQWIAFSCNTDRWKTGIWLFEIGIWRLNKTNLSDIANVEDWIAP